MRTRLYKQVIAGSLSGCVSFATSRVHAEPQWSAGVTAGVAGQGEGDKIWAKTGSHFGLVGHALFGRESNRDAGFGPYAGISMQGLHEFVASAGASVLLPVLETFPIIVSGGACARRADSQTSPGAEATLLWGTHSYNYHARYVMSGGLFTEARRTFGDAGATTLLFGARADLGVIALPFFLLAELLAGGSKESAPIK